MHPKNLMLIKNLRRSGPSSAGSLYRLWRSRSSNQICMGGHGHGESGLQKSAAVPVNGKQGRKRKTPTKKEKEEFTPCKTFRTEEDTKNLENSQVTISTAANEPFIDSSVQSSVKLMILNV